jgi:hypothetical protein
MSHDHGNSGPSYLKKKIQIGGSSSGLINYMPGQTVFHHDDISDQKRNRKSDVRVWAKQDKLVEKNSAWDKSTHPHNPLVERRTMENHVKDRGGAYLYNYRAETLPPSNPAPIDQSTKFHISIQQPEDVEKIQTMHFEINNMKTGKHNGMGEWIIHPNLADAKGWNNTVELQPGQKKKAYDDLMAASGKHTALKNKKTTVKPDYVSPMDRSAQLGEEVRKLKSSNTFSAHRPVFQSAEKPVNRKTLVNKYAIEPSRKYKTTKHSGVWEFNAAEGRHMWSDTGSFDYGSRGDIEEMRNPDGYNFSNPTMAGTDQDY